MNIVRTKSPAKKCTCQICGAEFPSNISYCPTCRRKEIWEGQKKEQFMMGAFPPRTVDVFRQIGGATAEAKKIAENLYRDPVHPYGLYIHGKVGTGKTILASGVLMEYAALEFIYGRGFVRAGETHIYDKVIQLLSRIRKTYGGNQGVLLEYPDADDILSLYSKCKMLVLDDIGVEKGSDWVFQTLFQIIDSRYDEKLPTIFTSNLSIGRLSELMGDDRLPSRINGMCIVVEVDGNDRRTKH